MTKYHFRITFHLSRIHDLNPSLELTDSLNLEPKTLNPEPFTSDIARKCNVYLGKISNVVNNKTDCQLTYLIEIATRLHVHPKDMFDIMFDLEEYYANLDGIAKNKNILKKIVEFIHVQN